MKTKTFLSVAFMLVLAVILAIVAFAAEGLNVKGLSIAGYQVRETGYNGLRTRFIFSENASLNHELVEVGSIVATAENFAKYDQSFDGSNSILKYVDGEFVTPSKNVVKTAIYRDGKIVGNHAKTENGFTFSVTVTNFQGEDQFKAEIVNCGYEIWKTSDGSYYVAFTREETEGYESNSLYKTTLSMLCSGTITIENSDNPIYNVLMECDHETFAPHANVDGYLFPDPLADGKFVALYIADSNEKISLESAGLGKYIARVSDTVFSKNLSLELPKIDDYWAEHIKEQLATLPEGKSFIAITDTHYESGSNDNAGKSADLMQYVRKMTGIEKVINLGDPFHQENTYEGAMEQLSRSMETKFFDYFGEDGMYAIGNHDSNVTMARSAEDKDIDPDGKNYKMDLILTDKDIYDNSFAHIEEGGKNNKNIVYDEKLLSIIDDMYKAKEIPAFVLENVAPEDAENNMFGNVNYSADEMYANLVSWAKMHYAYYDHESKICYIVLNTGGLTVTDFATLGGERWFFHPSQYEFIKTIFNQISKLYSDYDVVIAGHMLYDYSYYDRTGDTSFNSSLFKMLSAFEAGTSVSFTAKGNNELSGKLFGCEDNATSRTLNYDFSDRKFTGEVICITGHSHIDLDLVSQTKNGKYYQSVPYGEVENNLSDNAVQLILLNQDNYKDSKSDWEPNSQDMVLGTITEHSFTIFTITDDNTLVATRIGANDGNKQKTYKLSNYDEGWTFTAADSYKLEDSLSVMPRTVEAVINVPENISKAGVIFGNYNESIKLNFEIESGGCPRLYVNGASHVFSTDYDGNPINVSGDGLVHVAITVNDIKGSTATLICYINGEPVQTITGANTNWGFQAGDALPNFKIGGDNRDANSQYFKGSIRYAAAYSYARTAEQIKADYENFGGDDPMFCYDLSGRKVSQMTDVSGNGNNAGKGVEGWTFTAEDSYKLEDSLSKWPYTVEAVIHVPESYSGSSAGVIVGNYGGAGEDFNIEINPNGVPRFYCGGAEVCFENVNVIEKSSGGLVHVAITVNNKSGKTATLICYINGVEAERKDNQNISWSFTNGDLLDLKIGGDNRDGNSKYFKGSIKSVAAYSYARTPDQIMADYLNFGGDDPLFCYDLSGEKVSQMTDVSGNGFDAVNIK